MMQRGEDLRAESLQQIINIRASLNRGLSPLLLEPFPNTVALARPLLPLSVRPPMGSWFYGASSWRWLF